MTEGSRMRAGLGAVHGWMTVLAVRWRHSRGPALLHAWRRHLIAPLPIALRRRFLPPPREAWIVPVEDHLTIRAPGSAHPSDQVRIFPAATRDADARNVDASDVRRILMLPESSGLRRRLLWPAAAVRQLSSAIPLQIEHLTPFTPEQVVWDVQVREPMPAGKIAIELAVLPRSTLAPWLERARADGIGLDGVDFALGATSRHGFNLLPRTERARATRPWARIDGGLKILAAGLLIVLSVELHHAVRHRLALSEARLHRLESHAAQIRRTEHALLAQQTALQALRQRLDRQPRMDVLLNDLSHRLPRSTWIEHLSIHASGRITLQGESPDPPALIDVLKASPYLTHPSLEGTVQPDIQTGKERFLIVAALRAPAAPRHHA